YGVWSAAGVALTALLGSLLFSEPFSWVMAAGIALIVGGVVLVQSGAAG
ncbi:SMR family transporter, partial [Leucobacter sp. M11]